MKARLLLVLFVQALLLPAADVAATPEEARKHFEEAMRLLSTGERDRALAELRRAIELDEQYLEAHREYQDHVLEESRNNRQALIAEYRRRLEAHPDSPAFHYLLGRLLEGRERESELRRSVELDPSFCDGHMELAALYRVKNRAQSDEEILRARSLCPESATHRARLAITLTNWGKLSEAESEVEKARTLGLNPHLLAIVSNLPSTIQVRRTFNLVSFLAYLFALLVCSALVTWVIKSRLDSKKADRGVQFDVLFFFFCCLWFFLWFILAARGEARLDRSHGVPQLLISMCNAFWPAVVYHYYYIDWSAKIEPHRIHRYFIAYFYLAGAVLSGIFIYGFFAIRSYHFELGGTLMGWGARVFLLNFIGSVGLCFVALLKVNRAPGATGEEPEQRSSRNWEALVFALWLFVLWPMMIAGIFGVVSIGDFGPYLQLLATLMPLPFIVIGTYYGARYIFVDIFIKNTGLLTVIALITAAYYVYVVERYAGNNLWGNIKSPAVLLLLPLILAIPFLARILGKIIDRYIFRRRFTPAEVLSTFSREIRHVVDEQELLNVARNRLTDLFLTSHGIVYFSQEGSASSPIPGLIEELARTREPILADDLASSETALSCRKNAIEVIAPLVLAAEVRGYIALGRRHHREPYLSEDLRLLESLADQLEFALENIALERKRREQELREKELKILAGKAELRALRAQINPHFLFNALNTIASLIKKNPARAEETVEMLADVFRYTLVRSGSDFIPLSDELEFINAYLEIEKARFGTKLAVEMRIEPETQGIRIPSMLLQPLVENAVKHGIAPKLEGGKITISSVRGNGLLRLEVADTGVGFDSRSAGRLHNGGVGVRNVRDRLKNIYGSEDYLQIDSKPERGTTITITIPLKAAQ
jgi:GAF domain-containing protein